MDLVFIIGVFYVLASALGVLLIRSRPDLSFWLMLNMYFDPGGYLTYTTGSLLGRFDYSDMLIVFIVLSLSRINGIRQMINQNLLFKKFLTAFAWFFAFYFIVYGAVVPFIKDDSNYAIFLLKNRRFIYGIILLIGVYVFALRGVKYLYYVTIYTGAATLLLYFITITLKIPLIQFAEMERYAGAEMLRLGMLSYGLFGLILPVTIITLFLSQKKFFRLEHKRILYISGAFFLVALLMTLTRRTYIDIVGSIFLAAYFITKIIKSNVINISLKVILSAIGIIFLLLIIKPIYLNYSSKIFTDTFLLITSGEDTRGQSEKRMTGEGIYQDVFNETKENIFLGTGYTYYYWESIEALGSTKATSTRGFEFGQLADAAAEVPIINMFFSFGVIGVLLLLLLYTKIFKMGRNIYRLLRTNYNRMLVTHPSELVFSFVIVLWVAKIFTYNFWAIGGQFIGSNFQINAVYLGLGFAMLQVNMNLKNENYEYTNIGSTHR